MKKRNADQMKTLVLVNVTNKNRKFEPEQFVGSINLKNEKYFDTSDTNDEWN